MTAARHHGLVGVFVLLLVALTLAAPSSVAACTCDGSPSPGRVVFTGTVTDRAYISKLAPPGYVIAFHIDEVIGGDPGDGRVYTPLSMGSCGRDFQFGARYLVHANFSTPVGPYSGRPADVPLVTGICMQGEHLGFGSPVAVAFSPTGMIVIGVAVVAASIVYVSRRRSGPRAEPSE